MKELKIYIVSVLILLPVLSIIGQEEITQVPTPNAADFGRFGDIPVSPFSGRANVEVPIYSTTQRGVTLDVKLTYDTSGLPMNGLPGWTGHGWSLNVGGVITRSIRGICDEYIYPQHLAPLYSPTFNYFQSPGALQNLSLEGVKDSLFWEHNDFAPDIFYFNFMGKTGRFIYGNDGEWKVECNENLDVIFDVTNTTNYIPPFYDNFIPSGITYNIHPPKTIKGFTIVDEKGNKYIFGGHASFIEYSIPFFGACPTVNEQPWTASAWYLRQVQDRLGNILYDFIYQKGYYLVQAHNSLHFYRYNSFVQWPLGNSAGASIPRSNHVFPYSLTLTLPIYLSEVKTIDSTKIEFHLKDVDLTSRDLYPKLYQGTTILEKLKCGLGSCNEIIPDTTFFYLQGNSPLVAVYQKPGYEFTPFIYDERDEDPLVTMGLKCLDYIRIKTYGGDHYYHKFDYNTENRLHLVGIKTYNPIGFHPFALRDEYKFKYNHYDSIPSDYLTTAIDHWGYYNGNVYIPDTIQHYEAFYHTRDVNLQCTQYGMMTEIQYPTGGVSVLEYDQNSFSHYWDNTNQVLVDSTGYAGGLRVKSITEYEDSTRSKLLSKRDYTYTNGELQNRPIYYWPEWKAYGGSPQSKIGIISFNVHSILPLTNSFGQHIGYSDVKETLVDGVRKEYHFSNFSEFGDRGFFMTLMDASQSPETPFDERTDRSYGRGKILSILTKDSTNNKWNIQRYKYRTDNLENQYVLTSNGKYNKDETIVIGYFTGGINKIYYPKYDVISIIDSTRYGDTFIKDSIRYDKQDYTLNMTLDYPHKGFMRVCRSETTVRNGQKKKVEFTYPTSSLNSQLYNSLTCAEFYNPVIAQTTYRNNVFQKKEKTQYGLFSSVGHYLPQYKAEVFANDTTQTKVTYNSYASNGILSQYTPQGEAPVSLYWNTKDRLMAQSQGYISPIFDADAETPQAVLTFNGSNIFQHPNNHATTYVYDQHGNLKGMAEGQGNTINYGYDNFNRLSSITDLNGDTLQTFHYTIRKNGIENNVLTRTMQDSLSSHVVPSYVFYDGLGRPVQTASKGVNTSGKFVYEATVYDTNGREQQKWLPCEGGTTPLFLQDLSSESYSTYDESYAYDEYSYDPLGRPTVIMPPGERHRQANKPQRIEYVTNTSNQILKYKISSTLNNNGRYQISTNGYYAAGTLTGERYIDEDGKGYTIYKDIFDNVVYEERGTDCKTKYIYDTRGRLIAVLPPMVNQLIRSAEIYEYHYDDYNRLVKKYLPGCAAIQYWYDDADRLIYMQDGRLSSAGKYRFFLYDTLGRLVVQGICTDPNRTNYTSPLLTYFSIGNAGLCNTGYISEGPTPIEPEIEVVNYYDNYSFLSAPLFSNLDEGYDMQKNNPYLATTLQTGRIVSTTQGDYVMSALYYDAKGRLTDEREKSIDSLFINRQTEYTFTGEPLTITECVTNLKNAHTYPTITRYTYDTNSGILTSKSLQFGDGEPVTIAWNDYDGAGRIYMSERGDGAILDVYQYIASGSPKYIESSSTAPLLIENIHYNDGTGTPCYNGNISAVQWRTGNESLTRKYRYSYDDINRLIKAEYEVSNGQNPNPSASYDVDYAYNKSSSITSLVRKGQTNVGYGTIDSLAYSYNGNKPVHIKDFAGSMVYENAFDFKGDASTLVGYRYDNCGALTYDRYKGISSITYDFNGQPTNVEFQNGNSVSYVYTATGERLKCIVTTIEESSSVPLDSTWTWVNPATVIRDSTLHIGNYTLGTRPVLNDLYVTRYDFDGGYVSASGGYVRIHTYIPYTSHYHYYCRDHLGNNRVVVDEDGEIEQITHYYPYGGLFGDVNTEPDLQPYKYGGKEFQHTHGLDLYDFLARQYDPAIGLFSSMDPLCEKYYHINPYAYCTGNPVNAVDPDGRSPWTKLLKATVKVGKQVAKKGGKALWEGATYANAVSDLVDDYNTLTNNEESVGNRIWAGVSLASEMLPVSVGDVKGFSRNFSFIEHNKLMPKRKTRFFVDSNGKIVDIHATPKGSYRQPNGDRTDILQSKEHYNKKARRNDGFSHTHPNEINITSDGEEFQKWSNDTHSPTYVEINNIKDGIAEKILY